MKLRRRTLAKLGLFLLAGAVVNVGVAWGCALAGWMDLSKPIGWPWSLTRTQGAVWPRAFPSSIPAPSSTDAPDDMTVVIDGMGRTVHHATMSRSHDDGGFIVSEHWGAAGVAAGFPFRSMRGASFVHSNSRYESPPPGVRTRGHVALHGLQMTIRERGVVQLADLGVHGLLGHAPFMTRRIPLIPMPLGFAVNSLFYAVLLVPAGRATRRLNRSRRLARGLCPRCTYAVADLPTCPECGETIRRKVVEA